MADPSSDSNRRPGGDRRGSRWQGLLLASLATAGLALPACGSSDPQAPVILDTEKVERAIERSSLAQRGIRARVSCPSGVRQEKGLVFACTAAANGATTRFMVTELDGAGRVRYEAR